MAYTHTYKFKLGNGDEDIRGEAEFNVDGQASFTYSEGYTPASLTVEQAERITDLFATVRRIFIEFGNIEEIEFVEQ